MKLQNQETTMSIENREIPEDTPKRGFKMMGMMALCCGAPLLGVFAIGALGLQSVVLDNLVLLACPIGMGLMMFMMRGKRQGADGADAGHACCPPMTAKKEPRADRYLEETNDSTQATKIPTVSQP